VTDEEWNNVQKALVVGGLRACIDDILASHARNHRLLSDPNRRIIERAYDDGDGNTVTLVPTDDHPWFAGMWEDHEVMQGVEHDGTLYSVVALGGEGFVSVVVGRGLVDNTIGVVFNGTAEAKAYVQGLISQ